MVGETQRGTCRLIWYCWRYWWLHQDWTCAGIYSLGQLENGKPEIIKDECIIWSFFMRGSQLNHILVWSQMVQCLIVTNVWVVGAIFSINHPTLTRDLTQALQKQTSGSNNSPMSWNIRLGAAAICWCDWQVSRKIVAKIFLLTWLYQSHGQPWTWWNSFLYKVWQLQSYQNQNCWSDITMNWKW